MRRDGVILDRCRVRSLVYNDVMLPDLALRDHVLVDLQLPVWDSFRPEVDALDERLYLCHWLSTPNGRPSRS